MSTRETRLKLSPVMFALVIALAAALGAHAQALSAKPPLFVDCRGAPSASPTVILEAGAFGTSADWDRVLDDLAPRGRVCAYDRAGVGRSPPGPGGVSVVDKARELRRLLDQMGESGPIILVGHSNGALYAEAFARLYPERVAGLVYVNGVGTDDLEFPPLMANLAEERRLSKMAVSVARLGLSRLVADELSEGGLAPAAAQRKRAALECLRCLEVARDEDRLIVAGLRETAALPGDVRHIPTVVIVGDPSPGFDLAPIWRKAEIGPADRADTSWILDAPGASHVSPLSRDRAYVDAAVAWLRAPYLKAP